MNTKEYWLVSTEHLEDRLWFRDEEDFKAAMNFVAVLSCVLGVDILAFVLMSNHVHFVIRGSRKKVLEYVNEFKRRYSIYLGHRYGVKEYLRRNDVHLLLIEGEEAMERAVAYVQMNPVAAGICAHPSLYPWGTGNVFFSQVKPTGRILADIPNRSRMRMLHSECDTLPEEWIVGEEGVLLPQNYVMIKAVEACFRSANRMNYFYNTSSKAKKRMDASEENIPAFRDQVILAAMPDLCKSLFQKNTFLELKVSEQTELLRQLRYRFSSNVNQLARVCGLSYTEAARLMDCA